MEITSVNNEKIKNIKKLYNKKERIKQNKYIIEGIKIVEEAYLAKEVIELIIICESIYNNVGINKNVTDKLVKELSDKVMYVSENVFNSLSETVTPQGIMAVVEINKKSNEFSEDILFLDRVQDLGNIGTILRTARAFGFNTVILNKGCGDIYNSKVIRSAMGNIFKLNILVLEDLGIELLNELKEKGYSIYVTTLDNSKSIYEIEFNKKKVIIMGNEANGVCDEIIELANFNITIPMQDNTESLNVGIATGIVLSEIRRKQI
ncbi:MAG: RNA methyltransferase [Clostridiales bacterium]|nr:RNA methyltransferase [Clostridiales bacterium]